MALIPDRSKIDMMGIDRNTIEISATHHVIRCRRGVTITFVLLIVALAGGFSDLRGDSIYSLLGIGETIEGSDARFRGMGDIGTGVQDGQNLSFHNPAVLSNLEQARISLLVLPTRTHAKGNNGEQVTRSVKFPFIRTAFTLPWKGVLSAGLFTRQNFNFQARIDRYSLTPDISYTESWNGEGSLNDASFVYAQQLGSLLSLGVEYRYCFGSSKEEWIIDFDDEDYRDTRDRLTTEYRGAGYSVGVCSNLPGNVTVGASYTSGIDSSAEEKRENLDSGYRDYRNVDIYIPYSVNLGISFRPWRRLLVGADFRKNFWSETTSDGDTVPGFIDSEKYAFGGELYLGGKEGDFFFFQFPLRFGASWRTFPVLDSGNNKVHEIMGSLGTGYVLPQKKGTIDRAIQFNQRGRLSDNPIREEEWNIVIGFTSLEIWSRKI